MDLDTIAPLTGWEAVMGLVVGAFGVLAWWIAALMWRSRNGGDVTKWIVLALFCMGVSLALGTTIPALLAYHTAKPTYVLSRAFFWFGKLADTFAVAAFAWALLPRRVVSIEKHVVIKD